MFLYDLSWIILHLYEFRNWFNDFKATVLHIYFLNCYYLFIIHICFILKVICNIDYEIYMLWVKLCYSSYPKIAILRTKPILTKTEKYLDSPETFINSCWGRNWTQAWTYYIRYHFWWQQRGRKLAKLKTELAKPNLKTTKPI